MPVNFRILPSRGLVIVRFHGHATIGEVTRAFAAYSEHPDCAPGQKQLVDFSEVTSFDAAPAKLMRFQARQVEVFLADGAQTLLVFCAPHPLGRKMAQLAVHAWEGNGGAVVRVFETEDQALQTLGQPERSIAALNASVDIA